MAKLSPYYRQDEATDVDQAMRDYLDEHFLRQVPNLDKVNPRVLVVFSGGNAVGKTTLSRKLSEQLNGLMLENDAVKRALLKFKPELDTDRGELNKLTWQYTMNLYPRLQDITNNGLLIRDGIIDWYYDRILPLFEEAGYRLFIIGYDISPKKSIELLRQRGDTPTTKEDRLYNILEDHRIHMERFRKLHTPNLVLNDQNLFDHDVVVEELRKFIST